VLMCR